MYTTVGSCPKCGAPIYSPTVWHGVTPPPVTHTCQCAPRETVITTTGTTRTTPSKEKGVMANFNVVVDGVQYSDTDIRIMRERIAELEAQLFDCDQQWQHAVAKAMKLETENERLRALLHTERQSIAKKLDKIKIAASHLEDAVYNAAMEWK